jgi:hypothetical protein
MITPASQFEDKADLHFYCAIDELNAGEAVSGTLVAYESVSDQFIDMPVTIAIKKSIEHYTMLVPENYVHDVRMERLLTRISDTVPFAAFHSLKDFASYSRIRLLQEEAAFFPPCELESYIFPMAMSGESRYFYDRRSIVEAFKIKSLVCHSVFPRLSYQQNKPFFEVICIPNLFQKPVFYEKKGEAMKSLYWKVQFLEPAFRLKGDGFPSLFMTYCHMAGQEDSHILDRVHFEKQVNDVQCTGLQELSEKGIPHLMQFWKGSYDTGKGKKRMAYFTQSATCRLSEVIEKGKLTILQTRNVALQLVQTVCMMHEAHEVHGYLNTFSLYLQQLKEGNYSLQLSGLHIYSLISTHPAAGSEWTDFQAPPELFRAQKERRPYSLHPSLDVWHLGDLLFFMRYQFSLLKLFNLALSNSHYEQSLDLFQKHVEVTLSHSVNKIDQLIGGMFSLDPSDRPSMDIVMAEVHLWM